MQLVVSGFTAHSARPQGRDRHGFLEDYTFQETVTKCKLENSHPSKILVTNITTGTLSSQEKSGEDVDVFTEVSHREQGIRMVNKNHHSNSNGIYLR